MFKPYFNVDTYDIDVYLSDSKWIIDRFNKHFFLHIASDGSGIVGYTISNWGKLLDKLLEYNSRKNYDLKDLIEYAVWSGDLFEDAPPLLSFKDQVLKSLEIINIPSVNNLAAQ